MFFRKVPSGYMVRLKKGEEIITTLSSFVIQQNIKAGFIYGLGAAKDLVLGYYNSEKKQYSKRHFTREFEITSLIGDIAYFEGKPMVHAHVTLSGADFQSVAGHLFSGVISGTGEFLITVFDTQLERKFDPEVELNLLEL